MKWGGVQGTICRKSIWGTVIAHEGFHKVGGTGRFAGNQRIQALCVSSLCDGVNAATPQDCTASMQI